MEMILFRRKNSNESWIQAPIECMTDRQESGYEYRYFLIFVRDHINHILPIE